MSYFKDLIWMFQLNFYIFNYCIFKIILNFEFSNKGLIKQEQSHSHE